MLKLTDEQMRACYASGYFRRYTFEFGEFTLDADVIHTESVIIKEAICEDTELKLGGCIASSCEFEVSETVTDNINLSGLRFKAYLHLYRASEDESTGDYDNPDKAIGEEIGVIPMGVYNVRSVEMIDDADYKKVTAYDDLYDWNVDVTEWYNSFMPTSIKNVTYTDADGNAVDASSGIPSGATRKTTTEVVGIPLGAIRCELIKHLMSLNGNFDSAKYNQATNRSYMNDDVIITKTLSSNGAESIMGVDLLRYICELNGGFGKINRQGVFEIISIGATGGLYPENNIYPEDSKGTDGNLYPEDNFIYLGGDSEEEETPDFISTHYEEYNAQAISCVAFYTYRNDLEEVITDSTEESGAQMVSYPNDNENPYISSNPLTLQLSESELLQVAKNIYESISFITYRSNTTTLQGVPYYEPGDYYNVTKKISFESFVFSRTLTGIQGLRDEFVANGLEVRENNDSVYENIYASMVENRESEIVDEEKQDEIEDVTENQTSTFEYDNSHFLSVVASSQYVWDDNKNQIDEYGFGEPTLDYKQRKEYHASKYVRDRPIEHVYELPNVYDADGDAVYCLDTTGWLYRKKTTYKYPLRIPISYWFKVGKCSTFSYIREYNYSVSDVGKTYLDENTGKLYRLTGWNLSSSNPHFLWVFYKQLEKVTVQLETRIEQTSEEIALEASKRYEEDSYLSSRISVTADAITSEVNARKGADTELSSRIRQTAHSIELSTTDGAKSAGITIRIRDENGRVLDSDSDNITLTGVVGFEDLSGAGRTTINGANIKTGTIDADRINLQSVVSNTTSPIEFPSVGGITMGNSYYGTAINYSQGVVTSAVRRNGYGIGGNLLISGSGGGILMDSSTTFNSQAYFDYYSYFSAPARFYGTTYLDGSVYATGIRDATTSNMANGYINGNTGHMGLSTASSKRYKNRITIDINEELDPHKLLKMPIKQYRYNTDYLSNQMDKRYDKDVIGFIAEDVAEYYPIACETDEYGMIENWNERYIIPPMLSLIQEMYQKIKNLENDIIKLGGN